MLPVGGIKEKLLAAHRAGIKRVIIPERNGKDLVELPDEVKNTMEIVLVKKVAETLAATLEDEVNHPRRAAAAGRDRAADQRLTPRAPAPRAPTVTCPSVVGPISVRSIRA